MTLFRLKKFALAMLLATSLTTASPAACTCAQPEASEVSDGECHSHHEAEPVAEVSGITTLARESCICIIDQRSPFVSSKSGAKELKSKAPLYYGEPISAAFEGSAINVTDSSLPVLAGRLSYSTALRSLLPARAPPRL